MENVYAAGIAFLSTIVALYLKDVMDKKWAAKMEEQKQLDAAKVYADPLLLDTKSLVERLKAIFENNGRFLNRRAPKNEYVRYMYRSTLYRLCAVLGWLQVVDRELSGIEVKDQQLDTSIKAAINS